MQYATTAPENSWSKKKLKVRNILLIVLGCVLLLALAVGTAVGIVLHTQASFASTLPPTTPSTTVSDHITYTGTLRLSQPWPDSENTLKYNFTQEINDIMRNSSFQKYYISSTVQKYSPQDNSIEFTLEFSSDMRGLNLTSDPETDEYANQIEYIIKTGAITLPVNVSSIIIVDQLPTTTTKPLPSTKETTTTEMVTSTTEMVTSTTENVTSTTEMVPSTLENATSTTESVTSTTKMTTTEKPSTTTAAYVIKTSPDPRRCVYQDFELCKEFGNTFTLLPNYFGDESISSAANTFFTYFNHTVNSGCSKDVLYYFCNLVFPQCDEVNGTATAIYPCVSTCDEVTIPCDKEMPFPLDCSFFESDPSKCVTPPKDITTPAPKTCQSIEVNYDYCGDLGFNVTSFPSLFGSNIGEVRAAFTSYALSTVQSMCHPDVQFFYCGLFFPKCMDGDKLMPCKSLCEEVNAACEESSRFPVDCEIFSNDTQRCLSVNNTNMTPGPSTTPTPSTTTIPLGGTTDI
ncbi:hypothetical protein LOTGIDRAFT_167918 [Lottia gigantea]|uniref:FZ domain-containing protein n=1 Tax=Lottia gigantea TaxID=225164 RepID=V3Z3Y5_LOTGI|nr:hypothetical protein LOTGIDRAFT_167918 [Lottia gigantea]ESO85338.1 hypothetical protein LOTGIDRAFT_167918 [Lottia gigantea]